MKTSRKMQNFKVKVVKTFSKRGSTMTANGSSSDRKAEIMATGLGN